MNSDLKVVETNTLEKNVSWKINNDKIKGLMKEHKKSQLAKATSLNVRTIQAIERVRVINSIDFLKIVNALNLSFEDFKDLIKYD